MICPNETGVLPGSELHFNTIGALTQRLFYYVNCCGHYYCEHGYKISRQYMDSILVILVENGELRLKYQGQKYTAKKGDIVLMDGKKPQYYDTAEYVDFFWMHLSGANSADLCAHLTHACRGILHCSENNRKAAALIRRLIYQFSTNQTISDVEHSRLLYNLLCYLISSKQCRDLTEESANPIQRAIKFIQNHLGENLSLQRIADEVQISPSHLIRLFHTELHQSPHKYITLMRMNRAKYLLKSTELPIKTIAIEVGYRSESSFISAFTEKIGIPPLKFRKLPLG